MKRLMIVALAVACSCALCAGMVGCGSGASSSAASSASASATASASASAAAASTGNAAQPQANISPADINPSLVSGEGSYDIWYLDGDKSAAGVRFAPEQNDAGLSFVRVDASGQDGDGEFNLVITDEKHLRTPLDTAPKIDIVFVDDMTCYDYVTGSWYIRG